ncbi:MAG TPA: iron-sulfur cluster assembly accessory protein [Candidatus Saccharimonadia bacterium]|nr:iron-sulfur cluster assembly accessory protein [Candidatus Saccharimonadia bacterium]
MLTVTEAAKRKILSVIQAQGKPGDGLRITIVGRSSAGFTYDMHLVEEGDAQAEDSVVDVGDFPVIIDADSAPHMRDVIIDYVEDLQQSGFRIGNPNSVWTDPKAMAIQELLDTQINPAVASHGGHIELMDVHDDIVYIRFGGGCQGCGMVSVTLNQGVEQAIREAFPEIREIVDVTDHAAGTNPYYQSSKG